MRRISRVDCSLESFVAVCDRCGWRDGPWSTQTRADQAVDRHVLDAHPLVGRRRRERAMAASS